MEIEKTVDRENSVYRASEYTYSFKNFQTTKTFGKDIHKGEITLKDADNDQGNLLVEIMAFKNNTKPQNQEKMNEKKKVLKNLYAIFKSGEKVLDAFDSKVFSIKPRHIYEPKQGKGLKILTPKQMLQRS